MGVVTDSRKVRMKKEQFTPASRVDGRLVPDGEVLLGGHGVQTSLILLWYTSILCYLMNGAETG